MNFAVFMLKVELPKGTQRLLLHSCCAPCSGAIVECLLGSGIRPTIFFSNSNISTKEEYDLRKAEMLRYAKLFDLELIDDVYDHQAWLESIKGLETQPERGSRCQQCFRFRLKRAAEYAQNHGFDILSTSLASSRWKDLNQVNAAGLWACEDLKFWEMNWRKGGLQERRNEIIREQQFYNQTFCGCEFSK